jgi:hypothetical protein
MDTDPEHLLELRPEKAVAGQVTIINGEPHIVTTGAPMPLGDPEDWYARYRREVEFAYHIKTEAAKPGGLVCNIYSNHTHVPPPQFEWGQRMTSARDTRDQFAKLGLRGGWDWHANYESIKSEDQTQ